MNARVLVVDDDPATAEVVGNYLRAAGLEPGMRRTARLPCRWRRWQPDIVVLDLMLRPAVALPWPPNALIR
jgi:two-component system response regulator MtrA